MALDEGPQYVDIAECAMEDRVINHLEKEHSHRFRTMCHKNANLAKENKTLNDFFDREKKKSLHSIALNQAELKGKMMSLSQERYVNGLLTQLTELAFQSNGTENIEDEVASHADLEESNQAGPRYLRIEANAFHPSEMSLGSTIDILATTSTNLTAQDSTNSVPVESMESLDSSDPNPANVTDGEVIDSGVAEETKETGKQSTKVPTKSDEELKKVVDRLKLTDSYDIDKLRFLTQVMLKTLQRNDRFRYEDKMKLVYNLNRYFTSEADRAQTQSGARSSPNEKLKEDSTFLYLKPDRQKEIRERSNKDLQNDKSLKRRSRFGFDRRSSVPVLPDINRLSKSVISPEKERRHSLHADWRSRVQNLTTDKVNTTQNISHGTVHTIPPTIDKPQDHVKIEEELDDMMKIYLRLGHGALLKLPQNTNRTAIREKQKSWLRRDLRAKSTMPKTGVQDLRVVMKNCRYLRFPKDMIEHLELLV